MRFIPGKEKQKTGRSSPGFCLSDEVEHEGEHHEYAGDPLGEPGKPGVQSLGLVPGEEGVAVAAADGAGEPGALAALEQDDGDDHKAGEKLYYGNNCLDSATQNNQSFQIKNMAVIAGVLCYHKFGPFARLFSKNSAKKFNEAAKIAAEAPGEDIYHVF